MVEQQRLCAWCHTPIRPEARSDSKFCGVRCRQNSFRFSVHPATVAGGSARPMRFAYADPPYPGCAMYYPEKREVDHVRLIRRLQLHYTDGWALSTNQEGVRTLWPLIPEARLCVWVKAPPNVKTFRAQVSWEGLFVMGGRPQDASVATDLLDSLVYAGRHRAFPGAMIGMKPPAFAEWMFRQLGATAGDTLDDLFPGSGAIGEAWRRFTDPHSTAMKGVAAAGQGDATGGEP
jgi:hypothetical protein